MYDKSCRICLRAQNGEKFQEISYENNFDSVFQAFKEVFNWEVKKSDPVTKICMTCKAKLLDTFIFIKQARENDRKWRSYWLKSKKDDIILLSSDDEECPTVQIKQEKLENVMQHHTIPLQNIKEEGETSESEVEFEEKELNLNNSQENDINSMKIKEEPAHDLENSVEMRINLPDQSFTIPALDWSSSEKGESDMELEPPSFYDKNTGNVNETEKPPEISSTSSHVTSTTTKTCSEEIKKMGLNTLAEKLLDIKRNYFNYTKDQKIQIFYELDCHLCKELKFDTFENLEKHYSDEHKIRKNSVKCCDIDIFKPIMLDHIRYHLGMCKTSLKDHIKRLKTSFICEECGELLPTEKLLKHHVTRTHLNIFNQLRTRSLSLDPVGTTMLNMTNGEFKSSRYPCPVCEKPFYYECDLKRHSIKHMSPEEQLQYKKYECHDCGLKFFDKTEIQKHIETVHAKYHRKSSGQVVCLTCKKTLSNFHHFLRHNTLHWTEDERQRNLPYRCKFCSKRFFYKSLVRKHVKKHSCNSNDISTAHTGHFCPHCEKKFYVKKIMFERHLRTHWTKAQIEEHRARRKELMKFQCETCDKKFWREIDLIDHINFRHLKQYNHVCDECKKVFSCKRNLEQHKCYNKSAEKHECEFCGKLFGQPIGLKVHMYQWHLPGFIHECPTCKKGFNHYKAFAKHKNGCLEEILTNG
uniref:CSON001260 protein n=1 Tax=Culicoides sonorensis TaxID=179676 RepID=A0A336MH15_CULSO